MAENKLESIVLENLCSSGYDYRLRLRSSKYSPEDFIKVFIDLYGIDNADEFPYLVGNELQPYEIAVSIDYLKGWESGANIFYRLTEREAIESQSRLYETSYKFTERTVFSHEKAVNIMMEALQQIKRLNLHESRFYRNGPQWELDFLNFTAAIAYLEVNNLLDLNNDDVMRAVTQNYSYSGGIIFLAERAGKLKQAGVSDRNVRRFFSHLADLASHADYSEFALNMINGGISVNRAIKISGEMDRVLKEINGYGRTGNGYRTSQDLCEQLTMKTARLPVDRLDAYVRISRDFHNRLGRRFQDLDFEYFFNNVMSGLFESGIGTRTIQRFYNDLKKNKNKESWEKQLNFALPYIMYDANENYFCGDMYRLNPAFLADLFLNRGNLPEFVPEYFPGSQGRIHTAVFPEPLDFGDHVLPIRSLIKFSHTDTAEAKILEFYSRDEIVNVIGKTFPALYRDDPGSIWIEEIPGITVNQINSVFDTRKDRDMQAIIEEVTRKTARIHAASPLHIDVPVYLTSSDFSDHFRKIMESRLWGFFSDSELIALTEDYDVIANRLANSKYMEMVSDRHLGNFILTEGQEIRAVDADSVKITPVYYDLFRGILYDSGLDVDDFREYLGIYVMERNSAVSRVNSDDPQFAYSRVSKRIEIFNIQNPDEPVFLADNNPGSINEILSGFDPMLAMRLCGYYCLDSKGEFSESEFEEFYIDALHYVIHDTFVLSSGTKYTSTSKFESALRIALDAADRLIDYYREDSGKMRRIRNILSDKYNLLFPDGAPDDNMMYMYPVSSCPGTEVRIAI